MKHRFICLVLALVLLLCSCASAEDSAQVSQPSESEYIAETETESPDEEKVSPEPERSEAELPAASVPEAKAEVPAEEASQDAEETVSEPEQQTLDVLYWQALNACTLTGNTATDLVAVARTQLGYHESTVDCITSEEGDLCGRTMYGEWFSSPYHHWCTMFVSFCMYYAGLRVDGHSPCWSCDEWAAYLQTKTAEASQLAYASASVYFPKAGDLIFLKIGEFSGLTNHMGIVTEANESTQTVSYISGNCGDAVAEISLQAGDPTIVGYGPLSPRAIPASEQRTVSANWDDILVSVSGMLPTGLRLEISSLAADGSSCRLRLLLSDGTQWIQTNDVTVELSVPDSTDGEEWNISLQTNLVSETYTLTADAPLSVSLAACNYINLTRMRITEPS